jgi:sulfite reductase alpha subunit-like flavoprotein
LKLKGYPTRCIGIVLLLLFLIVYNVHVFVSCDDVNRPVFVLFGSQTGNSESIAKDVNDKLLALNVASRCLSLNEVAEISLKENARAVIIG